MFRSACKAFSLASKLHCNVILENQNPQNLLYMPNKFNTKAFFSTDKSAETTNDKASETSAMPEADFTDIVKRRIEKALVKSNISSLNNITSTTNIIANTTTNEEQKHGKEGETASQKFQWRSIKYQLIVFGASVLSGGILIVYHIGKPGVDEYGKIIKDEFSELPVWKQYIYRILRALYRLKEPSREILLPDVLQYPYYQPPYTLVIDLTDLLVHPDWTRKTGWRFKKRPGLSHFLECLCDMYEIVIYTAEQEMIALQLCDAIDEDHISISYVLGRNATDYVDGHHVKNLDKLNRDLSKVIVVVWNMNSVKFHSENVLRIKQWSGNDDDTALIDLTALLATIGQSEISDVRDALNYYKAFEDPLAGFRGNQLKLIEKEEADEAAALAQIPKVHPAIKRFTPTFLNRASYYL